MKKAVFLAMVIFAFMGCSSQASVQKKTDNPPKPLAPPKVKVHRPHPVVNEYIVKCGTKILREPCYDFPITYRHCYKKRCD